MQVGEKVKHRNQNIKGNVLEYKVIVNVPYLRLSTSAHLWQPADNFRTQTVERKRKLKRILGC